MEKWRHRVQLVNQLVVDALVGEEELEAAGAAEHPVVAADKLTTD